MTFDHSHPLQRIGFNSHIAQALADFELRRKPATDASHSGASPAPLMRVVEHHGTHSMVHDGNDTQLARPKPSLARDTQLAVGDWVITERTGIEIWMVDRLTPYSVLQRIAPSGEQRVLVSNVDVAFLVMGLDGDFNLRRLERYLALAKSSGVFPVVALTKADLCGNGDPAEVDARLDELDQRLPSGIARHALNATSPEETSSLLPYLEPGQTGVLLGSSGAGKSTLTNSLMGATVQSTGAVREDDSKGRHTTTSRQLHQLPNGSCLIDTPGLRGLRLDIDEATLDSLYEDIEALAGQCRYRDCAHEAEPDCAVRAALPADRLSNYHKLKREIARDRADVFTRQATKAHAKSIERSLRAMQKDRGR